MLGRFKTMQIFDEGFNLQGIEKKANNNAEGPPEVDQNPEYGAEDYNYYQASKVDNKNEYYGQNDDEYKSYIKDNNIDYE